MTAIRSIFCTSLAIAVFAGVGTDANTAWPYEIESKWSQSPLGSPLTLTFSYSNLLDGTFSPLTSVELKAAVAEALQVWSAVAPLQFQEAVDSGPLPTSSDSSYNGVNRPRLRYGNHSIDGAFGTLAHAYFPANSVTGLAGDVHLDSAETWRLTPGSGGFDIISVLTHETGHALGLDHEDDVPSIMHTFYSGVFSGPTTAFLYQDDINGIQANYGAGFGYVRDLSGRLFLSGTDGVNNVSVSVSGNTLTATSSGYGSFSRSMTDVAGLEINARGGADAIHLSGLPSTLGDVRLLSATVFVDSGTVKHNGSASLVENYHWANGAVLMQGGSLTVQGEETGGGSGGVATFLQTGGVHAVSASLHVGELGTGTLTVNGAGALTSASAYIGYGSGSIGSISVEGAGSTWTNGGNIYVGYQGIGSLRVSNDGSVAVNTGGQIIIGSQGELTGNSTLLGTMLNSGLVSPGPGTQTLTIDGNYTQSSAGKLRIEIGSPTDFDKLIVTDTINFGGTLEVALLNGFLPGEGSSFNVLDWSTRFGTFAQLILPGLDGPFVWSDGNLYSDGLLFVAIGYLPGDFDRDGSVTSQDIKAMLTALTDLNAYQTSHQLTPENLTAIGDLSGDGQVTNRDIQGLLNFISQSGMSSLAAVPEPGAFTLLFIGAITGIAITRTSRLNRSRMGRQER